MEQDVYGQTATTIACTLSYNKDFDIYYDLIIITKELLNEFPLTFDSLANLYHLPLINKFYPSNIPATEASKQAYDLFIGAHKSYLVEAFQDYKIFFFYIFNITFCYSIFIPSIFYKYIIYYI